MSWVATGVGVAGAVGGGFLASQGAGKQANAMREAIAYQRELDQRTRADLTPYRDFGATQLTDYNQWLADPNNSPASHMDPGYQFRRDQGNVGIENNAATAGLLQSGDTLRGLQTYGQGMASQEYNNAFNRYVQEGQFKQSNALMGQNASALTGQLANQGAANVSNTTSNANFGAQDQILGQMVAGLGGGVGNAFARHMAQKQPPPTTNGTANVFGPTWRPGDGGL